MKDLQGRVTLFGEKGLFLYKGKNVRNAKIEMLAITERLETNGSLLIKSKEKILQGLSKCTDKSFGAVFAALKTADGCSLMMLLSTLRGT